MNELCLYIKSSVIYCDNQGAIKILNSESSTSRTRHIDIRLQFAKTFVLNGKHQVRYVTTEDNIADIFTKGLPRISFEKFAKKMLHEE